MANKQVTINEMIYNTLRTKSDKIPKYYDVLIALGYKLRNDYTWNDSEYWAVEFAPDSALNFSKYKDKFFLYVATRHVRGNTKKVNYLNLIKMEKARKGNRPNYWYSDPRTPRIAKYYNLKERIKNAKSLLDTYSKYLADAQEKYNKAKQDVDHWIDNLIQAQNDFLDFRDELRGIYRNGIDD